MRTWIVVAGLVLGLAIVVVCVRALDTVAVFASYFNSDLDLYAEMEKSVILKNLLNFKMLWGE